MIVICAYDHAALPPPKKKEHSIDYHRVRRYTTINIYIYLNPFRGGKETNEMNVGRGMLMWLCCCPNVSVHSRKGAASTCRDASLARDGRGIAN